LCAFPIELTTIEPNVKNGYRVGVPQYQASSIAIG
jgi:hypothetical protein